jgi:hypothetical protein
MRIPRPAVLTGLFLALLGIAFAVFAEQVLARFSRLEGLPSDRLWLLRAYGIGTLAIAVAIMMETAETLPRWAPLVLGLLGALTLWAFAQQLADWWIDDAGITFSYSRSLATGVGLTFQPGAPPTEGYSSSLWMVMLAGMARLGVDIPTAAKALGLTCATLGMGLALRLVWLWTQSAAALVLTAAACCTAPVVTWAASGQEHALQGLLLVMVVFVAGTLRVWRIWAALLLTLFVLTRPEAPLLVIGVFVACVMADWRQARWRAIWRNLPLGLLPFLAFWGLIGFRLWYFGDPLPNPYYAKTSASSFSGLLNPFGGGWQYVLAGLRDSALLVLAGLCVFLLPRTTDRAALTVVAGLLVGHLVFVVWAKGDWMGQSRFLMPVVPLIAIAAATALRAISRPAVRAASGAALGGILLTATVTELDRFAADPTTPLAVVSEIGQTFAALSDRLGIDTPVLAHHDAGAISYERSIGLLDLGGLVDRDVARNMRDRAFLEDYVLVQRRPDYIFGAINFAAASGFTESEIFARDYIPLEFEDHPVMTSTLSHVRRDRVQEAPGLTVVRAPDGTPVRLVVAAGAL